MQTGSGTTKHCAYARCHNDTRYGHKPEMADVFFLRFPRQDKEKCTRWAKACGWIGFDVGRVKKNTYICSKHFVGGKGPTDHHPDPIPVNATRYDIEKFSRKPRRILKRRLPLSTLDGNINSSQPIDDDIHNNSIPINDEAVDVAHILLSLNNGPEDVESSIDKENTQVEFGQPLELQRPYLDMLPVINNFSQMTTFYVDKK